MAVAIAAIGLLSACGGSDDPPLEPLAAEGRDVMRASGCVACHGRNGDGGVGPSWVGRFGTMVELEDGEQVLVDADYLTRAIEDPNADRVAGFTVAMPENNLNEAEIAAVVAYIEALE
ncbi:MAG: cytochrome c [Actinomycetota bacterium]